MEPSRKSHAIGLSLFLWHNAIMIFRVQINDKIRTVKFLYVLY